MESKLYISFEYQAHDKSYLICIRFTLKSNFGWDRFR